MPTTFWGWIVFILQENGMLFLKGTGMTMLVAITGTVIGFVIGLLVAILRTIPLNPGDNWLKKGLLYILRFILATYIEVFRGTPMIVQAMVIFYGAMQYLGLDLPSTTAAIIVISINTGAYMAEIIRGGIISVDSGQTEGAHSLGMTHWQTMVNVVLPQAVRNIMPAIGNEFVVNIKDSSVLNVIAVSELFFTAKSVSGTYYKFFEAFFVAAAIYFVLTFTTTRILRWIEKKMDGPENYRIIPGSQTDVSAIVNTNLKTTRKGGR